MSQGRGELWQVRPAGAPHDGREVPFEVLCQGIQEESVGDLDEVKGPRDSAWQCVGEHPLAHQYLPQPDRLAPRVAEDSESDLTPMIDVTFQLLIFFMITATFVVQKTLDLPKSEPDPEGVAAVTMDELEKSNVMVHVGADGVVTVDRQPAEVNVLPAALRRAVRDKGAAEVVLDVEDQAVHDLVVKVIDAAGAANVEKVHFVSRVE